MAPVEGYWGNVTATIDWCEENYVMSPYIAEFWNTISNVMMIIPPIFLLLTNWQFDFEKRIISCIVGLAVVGVGSWLFHMTLLYYMQLLDELPMLYGSSLLLYSLLELDSPLNKDNTALKFGLFIYCLSSTLVYLFVRSPLFHEVSYGLLVLATTATCARIVIHQGQKLNGDLAKASLVIYLFGFALWLMDNQYCGHIRELRSQRFAAFGFITQLHAWWHLLAGFGTYLTLLFVIDSRYRLVRMAGKRPRKRYWLLVFPYVTMEETA